MYIISINYYLESDSLEDQSDESNEKSHRTIIQIANDIAYMIGLSKMNERLHDMTPNRMLLQKKKL
jgi:hypothetical protein